LKSSTDEEGEKTTASLEILKGSVVMIWDEDERSSFSSLIKGSNEGEEVGDEGLYERPVVIFFHLLDPSNSWATSSKPSWDNKKRRNKRTLTIIIE
jgi:hypothetical protein